MLRRFPYLRTLATVCILSLTIQVAAPLFASPSTSGGVKETVSPLSTDSNNSSPKLLAWANSLWNLILSNLQSGAPPLNPAPGSPQPWQPAYPVYSGVVNMATGNLTASSSSKSIPQAKETIVLLHRRVVAVSQPVYIRAIFANAPTGFVSVSFSCSEGHFVGCDGSGLTNLNTGASGHTLRGFTFWRSAEAIWIAPATPAKVSIVATLRTIDGGEWSARSVVEVREKVSPHIQCEADPPVWVAYLCEDERVRIHIRVLNENGLPVENSKVHITTDRGMLVTRRPVLTNRQQVFWEAGDESDGVQDYRPVVRTGTVWRQEEVRTTSVDAFTDEGGSVCLYLEPCAQFGVAHVSVLTGTVMEVLPVVLISPEGLRMMFSGSGLAFANQPEVIRAVLLDAFGNPQAGEQVAFYSSIGRVEPVQQTTDTDGECAVALYSAGIDGYATVTAKAAGYVAKHYTRVHGDVTPANLQLQPSGLPTIHFEVYAPAEVRPEQAGFPSSETRGAVIVVADNSPAMPLSIYTGVQPVQYPGGHQHHSGRPAGTCTPWQGILVGTWATTYVASAISGEEQIRVIPSAAFPFNPQPPNPSTTVRVRVPDLQDLPPGEGYMLVGATTTHPSNHWAAPDVITRLQNIARDFRTECSSQSGYRALNYNDVSLSWGGLFDINANWSPPHREHRRGREVDFSNADALPSALQTALRNIIQRHGGSVLNEGNHWHVRF